MSVAEVQARTQEIDARLRQLFGSPLTAAAPLTTAPGVDSTGAADLGSFSSSLSDAQAAAGSPLVAAGTGAAAATVPAAAAPVADLGLVDRVLGREEAYRYAAEMNDVDPDDTRVDRVTGPGLLESLLSAHSPAGGTEATALEPGRSTVCTGAPAARAITAKPRVKRSMGGRAVRLPSGNTINCRPSRTASAARRIMGSGASFRT